MTDPTSKELVDLLTAPLFSVQEMRERMGKLNLNYNFQEYLINKKIKETLNQNDKIKDEKLMKEIK